MTRQPIEILSLNQLEEFVKKNNQPKFRALQIAEWLYVHNVNDFSSMTNLPKAFINKLSSCFVITNIHANKTLISKDGTRKYILQLTDTNKDNDQTAYIETVGIPSANKNSNQLTVCVSTQVGCAMACKFCATGKQGFSFNLNPGSIVKQIMYASKDFNQRVSNVVLMGQGEPFLNYDNVMSALEIINSPKLLNLGARKITISTCGIIPGINKFSKINKQYGLAVSLHSANQQTRNFIMPGVINYNLDKLKKSLINYTSSTNRRITFEYLMIKGINDSEDDLNALKEYCSNILCHVNLIKFNSISESKLIASDDQTISKWLDVLNNNGIETTLRASRGSDIDAACGQLINSLNK